MNRSRLAPRIWITAVLVFSALAAGNVAATTYDLHIRPYCPPGDFCGFGNENQLRQKVLRIVQEVNLQWAVVGISFRPTIFPIDDTNPDYYQVAACTSPNGKTASTQSGSLCNPTVTFGECTGDCVCEDLSTMCSNFSGCTGIGDGTCHARSRQRRVVWRRAVAMQNPGAVTIMVTSNGGTCCTNPPGPNDPTDSLFGLYCTARGGVQGIGSGWAHELGHYFCLRHTFTNQDFANSAPAEPNHDYDTCFGVTDTPSDPNVAEKSDLIRQCAGDQVPCDANTPCEPGEGPCQITAVAHQREYCTPMVFNNPDFGSPHASYCTSSCLRCLNGPCSPGGNPLTTLGYDPHEHAAMSYYDTRCTGPVVVSGQRFEAFSPTSITAMQSCISTYSERSSMPNVCPSGDIDSDGICTGVDICPFDPDTNQLDTDGDGDGDACDLCPGNPNPTGDKDKDGIGDICDPDLDGDGCDNGVDDHPNDSMVWSGSTTYIGCSITTESYYSFEGGDADGDFILDCQDVDDDNDGVCDGPTGHAWVDGTHGEPWPLGCQAGPDPCPTDDLDNCVKVQDGPPCVGQWLECATIDCEEYYIRIVDLINPDPENELIITDFEIFDRTIFMRPEIGRTVSELAISLQGVNVGGAAGAAPGRGATLLRMEMWNASTGALVGVIFDDYDPSSIVYGEITQGSVLAVTPTDDAAGPQLRVEARWAVGIGEGVVPVDADGDSRPDWIDNCQDVANFRQVDSDGDGFGNACDADLDNDAMVTPADVNAVLACLGADLTLTMPISEPDDPSMMDPGGFEQAPPDPEAYALTLACYDADLNEDEIVDDSDLQRAQAAEGQAPGPSSRRNLAPIADAGPDRQVLCGSSALLDGSSSYDPDGHSLSCQWSSTAACVIEDPSSCVTYASCPEGTHLASLVVNDGTTDSLMDSSLLTVACGGPGRVPPSLNVNPSPAGGGELILDWAPSCLSGAQDYGIYEGALGSWYSHTFVDCSDDGADYSEAIMPGAGSRYFLVVPLGSDEGSYGSDSGGAERPRDGSGAACRPIQDLGACPP